MSIFGNLKSEGLEEAQDRLGGFTRFETDSYTGKLKLAYAGASQKGAQFVHLTIDIDGKDYTETVYITNARGENFFLNKDDSSKKVPLPGFTLINNICLITTGKELCDQATEEKTVKVYDAAEKKELPKSVPVLIDLLGSDIGVCIVKSLEDKTEKQGNEYVPVAGKGVERNNIDTVFEPNSKLTVFEAQQAEKSGKDPVAAFVDAWTAKNKGQTRDKRTVGEDGSQAGRPTRSGNSSSPPQQGQTSTKRSLFSNAA